MGVAGWVNQKQDRLYHGEQQMEIKRPMRWIQDLCSRVESAHQAAKSKEVYATIKKITN